MVTFKYSTMPEGPEIHRAADAVSAALKGRACMAVHFSHPQLRSFERELTGRVVRSVASRGKAMLIGFAGGLTIYSHNQLYGRWHTGPAYEYPDTKRQLRLAIHNEFYSALLYSASEIAVLDESSLAVHPFLRNLGPDPQDTSLRSEQIMARLQQPGFRRRQLGGLLLSQAFLAGIGNYLRCEILFTAGLHPRMTATDCSANQLHRLAEAALRLPRQSYQTKGITNHPERAERLMEQGSTFEEARFLVFRRHGKPCYHCGDLVLKSAFHGRPCYTCPSCQAMA